MRVTLDLKLSADQQKAFDAVVNLSGPVNLPRSLVLKQGTGAGQADRLYVKTSTLNASANEDLDLAGGVTDMYGTTLTFAKIGLLYVEAKVTNANNVLIGGAAATQWASWLGDVSDKVVIRPGGFILLGCGKDDANRYAVGAGASDLLRVANSAAGSAVTYTMLLAGTSA